MERRRSTCGYLGLGQKIAGDGLDPIAGQCHDGAVHGEGLSAERSKGLATAPAHPHRPKDGPARLRIPGIAPDRLCRWVFLAPVPVAFEVAGITKALLGNEAGR
jgi:hypothetical protein